MKKITILMFMLTLVLASSTLAECTLNGEVVPCDQMWEEIWWIFPLIGIGLIIGALFMAFWIWMLVDCATREFNDKVVWIIVLMFAGIIGAIVYYFVIKKKNKI